jgi:hypothetical protein
MRALLAATAGITVAGITVGRSRTAATAMVLSKLNGNMTKGRSFPDRGVMLRAQPVKSPPRNNPVSLG